MWFVRYIVIKLTLVVKIDNSTGLHGNWKVLHSHLCVHVACDLIFECVVFWRAKMVHLFAHFLCLHHRHAEYVCAHMTRRTDVTSFHLLFVSFYVLKERQKKTDQEISITISGYYLHAWYSDEFIWTIRLATDPMEAVSVWVSWMTQITENTDRNVVMLQNWIVFLCHSILIRKITYATPEMKPADLPFLLYLAAGNAKEMKASSALIL